MKNIKNTIVAVFACAIFFTGADVASAGGLVVIGHRDNPVPALTIDQVKKIYLGKDRSFTPIDQRKGAAVRTEFYKKVVKKEGEKLAAYWNRRIFSGKGHPPKEIGGADAAIKEWIKDRPDDIGYINKSSVDSSIKVLLFVP